MRNKIVMIGMMVLAIGMVACGGNSEPTSAPPTVAVADTIAAPTQEPAQATPAGVATDTTAPTPSTSSGQAQPAATQASSSNASGGQGVPIGNIQDVLNKACNALNAQDNLNINISMTGDQTGQVLYQISGKDKAHFILTQDSGIQESIILPTGLYTKKGDTWKKDKVPNATFAQQMITLTRSATGLFVCFNQKGEKSPLEGEITGVAANVALPEVVNGVPCLVYNVNVSVKTEDSSGTGTGTYWLGATDSLPYKLNLTYNGTKSDGTKVSGQVQSTYSYQAVDIEPPIP